MDISGKHNNVVTLGIDLFNNIFKYERFDLLTYVGLKTTRDTAVQPNAI